MERPLIEFEGPEVVVDSEQFILVQLFDLRAQKQQLSPRRTAPCRRRQQRPRRRQFGPFALFRRFPEGVGSRGIQAIGAAASLYALNTANLLLDVLFISSTHGGVEQQ